MITYYPVLEFFKYSAPLIGKKEFVLCYAGLLKLDRGVTKIIQSAKIIAAKHSELTIGVKLVGKFESNKEEEHIKNLIMSAPNVRIELAGWREYPKISDQLLNVDICLDLREKNFIYRNSLPIKVFEYMACGKPFIFSNIKPIRDEIEFEKCGFLVNPNDIGSIVKAIESYIDEKDQLLQHARSSRELIESRYNWEKESAKLINLVRSLHKAENL